MALSQQTVTVTPSPSRFKTPHATATWATGLGGATKLVAAVPIAPASRDVSGEGFVNVRARIDSGTVTVEAYGPAFNAPVQVLVTVDA